MSVDDQLDQWYDVQAVAAMMELAGRPRHRCPPDMPPCPDCQAIEEEEDEREFGL